MIQRDSKLNILHVFDHSIPSHDGYSFRSYNILKEQRALGINTFHVTGIKHKNTGVETESVDGLDFYRTTKQNQLLSRLPIIGQYEVVRSLQKRIEEVLSTENIDVVHAHSPVLNGMAALNAARKFNIPVVYEIRAFWEDASASVGTSKEGDLRYRITKHLETRVCEKVNAIFTICDGLKTDLVSRGIPKEKVTLIPNAVDVSKFSGDFEPNLKLKAELGLSDTFILGFIGSFYEYEGIDILINAMPSILKKIENAKILLVGGGLEEENLRKQVESMKLQDNVIFTGRIPHDQVQDYYNLVDIFVYPRTKIRLTDLVTPLKPLEAMAQCKLVAASDIGGHNELIQNGETGILFKPDNPEDLAATIIQAHATQSSWGDITANGRRYVEDVRNWKQSISNYPAVYESVVKR